MKSPKSFLNKKGQTLMERLKVEDATKIPSLLKLILGLLLAWAIWFFTGFVDIALFALSLFLISQFSGFFKGTGVTILVLQGFFQAVTYVLPRWAFWSTMFFIILGSYILLLLYTFIRYMKSTPKKMPPDALLLLYIYTAILIFFNVIWPIIAGPIISSFPTLTRTLEGSGKTSRSTFRALPDFASYAQQQEAIWDQSGSQEIYVPPNVAFRIRNLQATPPSGLCFGEDREGGTSFHITSILENIGESDLLSVQTGLKLSVGQVSGIGTLSNNSEILEEAGINNLYPCEGAIYAGSDGEIMQEWLVQGKGYICKQKIDTLYTSQPRSMSCMNLYIDKTVDEETAVTCYIDAYAEANYHTRSLLPVQFIDQEYALINQIDYYSPPSTTSIGGGSLSMESQSQPILDVDSSSFAVTIGISNAGEGSIKEVDAMYLWIPEEFGTCGGSHFQCTLSEDLDCEFETTKIEIADSVNTNLLAVSHDLSTINLYSDRYGINQKLSGLQYFTYNSANMFIYNEAAIGREVFGVNTYSNTIIAFHSSIRSFIVQRDSISAYNLLFYTFDGDEITSVDLVEEQSVNIVNTDLTVTLLAEGTKIVDEGSLTGKEWQKTCQEMKDLGYNLCGIQVESKCVFNGAAFQSELGNANPCYESDGSCTMNCDLWGKTALEKSDTWTVGSTEVPVGEVVEFCNSLAEIAADDMCILENIEQLTRYSCTLDIPYPVTTDTFRKTFLFRADAFYDYKVETTTTVSGEFCG